MESFCNSKKQEVVVEEEPVSPSTAQYLNTSVLSISTLAVLDFQVPFDDSLAMHLLSDVFVPINPRFSSIMIRDDKGRKRWNKVEVKLEDHVHIPVFPSGLPLKSYDEYLENYLSKLAIEQFPQSRPLWEVHIIKYPTSNAARNVIFKLHHALGDGYNLMGALLSCLQKADHNNDPTTSITFPHFRRRSSQQEGRDKNILAIFKNVPRVFSSVFNTIYDFGWSTLRSSMVEDGRSPIRSGNVGVEFSPRTISTMSFSLDHIKQIKAKLGVTVNDVITGVIFLGTRLYITSLVLLNTRQISGYKSVEEMMKPDKANASKWGNQFCFLHVSVPELNTCVEDLNPIDFVMKTQKLIQRKKSSLAVYLNGWFLEVMRKFKGPEVTSKYIHSTLKNASLSMSNMIGPVEQMALAKHIVKGLYFMVVGSPESLIITMVSYMGELRVAFGMERDHIDSQKFKSCIENAFNMMFKAACNPSLNANP